MDALWKGSRLVVPCPLPLGLRLARRSGPLFLRKIAPPKETYKERTATTPRNASGVFASPAVYGFAGGKVGKAPFCVHVEKWE